MPLLHNRITLGGSLYTAEKWAVQLHFGTGTAAVTAFPDLTTVASAIGTALAALDIASPTNAAMVAKTKGAKLERIDVAAMSDGIVTNSSFASIAPPGGGSEGLPPQCAGVVSLLTNVNTRSGRGRCFWPVLNTSQVVGGFWPSGNAGFLTGFQAILNTCAQKLQITGGADLAIYAPVVYSRKLNQVNIITRLRVNNVVDTQRRRSWNMPETNATAAYTVA